MAQAMRPGPTGAFPDGKIGDTDDGELSIAIARDEENGLIHVNFGVPVAWLAFTPEGAVALAHGLLDKARDVTEGKFDA